MELVEIDAGAGRLEVLPILLLADDAEAHVRAHLDDGNVFVLRDEETGEAIGAVQTVDREDEGDAVELTLVAVGEPHQRAGHGRELIRLVLDRLRRSGRYARALVGTSNAGIGTLAFYQRCGFRMLRIERDYFDEARGYDGTEMENGIVHRDLVWFDQPL